MIDVTGVGLARGRRRGLLATLVVLALGTLLATSAGATGPAAKAARRHSLGVHDTGNLHLTHKSGATLYESGRATGTLPGSITAVFHTGITRVTGTVSFHGRRGSITMSAVGYPRSAGTIARFTGNIAVRSGTGAYSRALGSGTFSGSVNRRTWTVSVRADANVTY